MATLFWLAGALVCASGAALAETVTVRTFAGSGQLGFEDGPATKASFILPMGMAFDAAGNLYVSDGAAQRIRVIDRNATVRTIAGGGASIDGGLWVPGGYADGAGSQARFNRPAGIAVASNGDVFIADSFNHCIRRMRPDGEVSTFAGSPLAAGILDGPRLTAQFVRPTGLAFDRSGNLYVADPMTQLRKIDRAGNVSNLPVGNQPLDVAVYDGPSGPTLFVSGNEGLIVVGPDGKQHRYSTVDAHLAGDAILQGGHKLGHPFGVAALDDHSLLYTDVRSNTVRYLDTRYGLERIVAGAPNEDASADTAGYIDGVGNAARFNAPMGITIRSASQIMLADAGNRRIRMMTPPDRRGPLMLSSDLFAPHDFSAQDFKIALAGNSVVWYDTDWSSSIEGRIEYLLAADPRFPSKKVHVRVVPVWGTGGLDAQDQYLKATMATGLFNAFLLNINAIDIAGSFGLNFLEVSKHAAQWQGRLTEKLRTVKKDAAAAGVPVAVVIEPLPHQLALTENAWGAIIAPPSPPDLAFGGLLRSAVRDSGIPMVDLWPPFLADLRSRSHRALYETDNVHFSVHGREVASTEITRVLLTLQPWKTKR